MVVGVVEFVEGGWEVWVEGGGGEEGEDFCAVLGLVLRLRLR